MKFRKLLVVTSVLFLVISCKTQQKVRLKELYQKISEELEGGFHPEDTVKSPTLALTKKKEEKKQEAAAKIKKRVFYGYKTRRAFARKGGKNKRREWELFYVLKTYVEPSVYVKDFYWYHRKKRQIMTGKIDDADKPYARILHGPYLKRVDKKLVEEGIFYIGGKHGRWTKYDKNFLLLEKKRFYKGIPTDAEISYYDADQKKIKEIIPYQLGRKDGTYYYFAPDATILKTGQYKDDVKIGLWVEYFPNKKKKMEIQYQKDPYLGIAPYIAKEYDEKGKLIYDFRKDGARADSTSFKF